MRFLSETRGNEAEIIETHFISLRADAQMLRHHLQEELEYHVTTRPEISYPF